MTQSSGNTLKIAILDMYEGVENQGMRCIREIINQFGDMNSLDIERTEFDVRVKEDLPGLDHDIYICTGGPGSPVESAGTSWENKFFAWIEMVEKYNATTAQPRKPVLFICHSFQLACRYFDIALVSKRRSTSFGVFPIHYVSADHNEPVFEGLKDPFYAVDSRDYQVTQPNLKKLQEMGATILAIEKARPHVPLERAIMAIRFNSYMIGTQFHPEADAIGMSLYLQTPDRRKTVVENHGEEKWQSMIDQLGDPDKIMHTYARILPNFLSYSLTTLRESLPEAAEQLGSLSA